MKTTTASDFVEHPSDVLTSVETGEEVAIYRGDVLIAHVVPALAQVQQQNGSSEKLDWSKSAAFTRDRTGARILTAKEVRSLLG